MRNLPSRPLKCPKNSSFQKWVAHRLQRHLLAARHRLPLHRRQTELNHSQAGTVTMFQVPVAAVVRAPPKLGANG